MECKEEKENLKWVSYSVLIETSWNVKFDITGYPVYVGFVLIETSWNVKAEAAEDENLRATVLIETSWNVK